VTGVQTCALPIFKQVGEGIVLYDASGVVKSYCGFFRSSEIAAWHIGAALCLLLALATAPGRRLKLAAAALAPLLVAAGVLTGRRKLLMVVVLFVSLFAFLMGTRRRHARSAYPALALAAGVALGLYLGDIIGAAGPQERLGAYLRRGGTVFAEAPGRFRLLGLESIWWAVAEFGLFGVGAGVLGQGGQYFGGGGGRYVGSAEGGLGKITGELGLPGLLLFAWLAILAAGQARRLLRQAEEGGAERHCLSVGLVALIAANLPSFIVASQAFGDPFVVLSLGLYAGFVAGLNAPAAAGAGAADEQSGAGAPLRIAPRPWGRV
jgi:hypothetical protein